ncbi:MAG: extracellular solute-binding protein [Propionibacteriaceae bacterium]|jgi:multiple sugar transport system substrate-binding protein|nr:extracellular solute-binding protein [Propionibacteriaceae bacterium]
MTARLTGSTWDHPRGLDSLLAASEAFTAQHPEIEVRWDARSLQDFADFSLEALVQSYDLVVFDHPFVGRAAAAGLLAPLEQVLPDDCLADQARWSAGPSHESYRWGGRQWALAIDAACHVSAARPDLLDSRPASWDQVVELARRRPGAVALPALAIDAFLAFLTLIATESGEPFAADGGIADLEAAAGALERLAELLAFAHPASLGSNPIQVLESMATGEQIAYAPITFGYVNYSTPGRRRHQVEFGPVAAVAGQTARGVLGGAGLGIAAGTSRAEEAALFAAFVASGPVQRGPYARAGGQPGHRSAWFDQDLDRRVGGFFSATWPAIEAAYLRPRWPGFIEAQAVAADWTHSWLEHPDVPAVRLARRLSQHFKRARAAADTPAPTRLPQDARPTRPPNTSAPTLAPTSARTPASTSASTPARTPVPTSAPTPARTPAPMSAPTLTPTPAQND